MSGPNPPEPGASGSDLPDQPGKHSAPEEPTEVAGADADGGETEFYSQAYSAPESEQFTSGPYVPSDVALYDYDDYDASTELVDTSPPPRWPWVVGITAIIAAVALVASVAVLVTRDDDTSNLATPRPSTTTSAPPVQARAGPEHHDGAADHHHDACRTPPGHLFGDGHQGPG